MSEISTENLSETEINKLKLILKAGIEATELDIERNLNKETNNLEYENETNNINIVKKLLKADEINTIKQLHKYINQIVAIKKFNEYAVKILGENISLEFNVHEPKKRQFFVIIANSFIRNKVELLENTQNTILSFQKSITDYLLPLVNDLHGIEPSEFAIGIFNYLYKILPSSINSSSYNVEVENLITANILNICEHYCSKKEKAILNNYIETYKPEFKNLEMLCQKKYKLEKKLRETSDNSQKINLAKEIIKIDAKIAISKSNCLEISKQAIQAIDKQNQKNNQQQK